MFTQKYFPRFVRFHRLVNSLIGVIAISLAVSATAQEVDQMSFSELQSSADRLIANGELGRAYPFLAEILNRFTHLEEEGDVSLEDPTFLAAEGKLVLYQSTGDRAHLQDAERLLLRFREKYPRSNRMRGVTRRLGLLYAETGRPAEAITELEKLLVPPFSTGLSRSDEDEVLHTLTLLYYSLPDFERGRQVYERAIERVRNADHRVLAASALFETRMAAREFDSALELIPLLASESEARYRPRLNVAFFRASDVFVNMQRFVDASLVLGLAMTTPQMREYFEASKERAENQIAWLRDTNPGSARIGELEREVERLRGNLEAMAELPSLETDLLVRKARNYAQTGRTFEAFWLFYRLMTEFPEDEQIEFFAYATFANARELGKDDLAIEVGERYLRDFPDGRFAGDTLLGVTILHHAAVRDDEFEQSALKYLNDFPDNDNTVTVLSLLGGRLMEMGETGRLHRELQTLEDIHPQAFYMDGIHYWRGMAFMQDREFSDAYERFVIVDEQYSGGIYAGESRFRLGVIEFVQERFNDARSTLLSFQADFPGNPNIDQAFYFLAQIALLADNPEEAIEHYQNGIAATSSADMRDLFHFELAELFHALNRHDETIELLETYMVNHPGDSDTARIFLHLGKAFEEKREPQRMVELYRQAIEEVRTEELDLGLEAILSRFGPRIQHNRDLFERTVAFLRRMETDRAFLQVMATDMGEFFNFFFENPGVDQTLFPKMRNDPRFRRALLDDIAPLVELREHYESQFDFLRTEDLPRFLRSELDDARVADDFVNEIRLVMGLWAAAANEPLSRPIRETDFAALGPVSLLFAAGVFERDNNPSMAVSAMEDLVERFRTDPNAVTALERLSRFAEAEGDLETALFYIRAVAAEFPATPRAPIAILEEARILTAQGNYTEARQRLEYILRVSEWRGELYARALYEIGASYRAEGRLAEAHGFMERVFVAYGHFGEWAAKAYYADARILMDMGQRDDARNTLEEALNTNLRGAPPEILEEMRALLARI